jgi:hypothetical protein
MENITLSKLREYQKFEGDDDMLSRGSNKRLNSSEEWYLIRSLIQDITLVKKGLASMEYTEKLNNDLLKYCDCETTVKEIEEWPWPQLATQTDF